MVTDVDWIVQMMRLFSFLIPCPAKLFPPSELAQAHAWIIAVDEPEKRTSCMRSDLYIMQRSGVRDDKAQKSGLIYVLNNLGDKWSGATVKTKWKNQKFVPVAWDGHDTAAPNERTTNTDGSSEFPAPPRGYVGLRAGIAL